MLVLDRAHFDHMTGADRALQLEVLGLFRMQIDAWRAAFGTGESWRDAVHTMKGSARGIGLMALAAACEAAEQASNADHADAMQSLQAHLEDALAALEQFAAEAA
ncbi:Hpt domain-containing protein [Terricaulis silvestris]|uniref:Hpt domain protein n=1 Tax=Terricaulis silvestris TaxID=2686094 RepID=A0A6I6MKI4_9CAUL|nr:Hpt domain-containing protein [Terricaulis silvestris]QGZ95845.1 Hpt domain protein [Terricaulis silvestris]